MVVLGEPPVPAARSPRPAVTLVVATVGLGLNLRAWLLLGPHLHERFDLGPARHVLLVGLPLLVAALVRLPVGVLTDRYGARVMFPAVSLAAAASAFGVGLAGSLPGVVVAGAAAGVAGAAFVVGAALVSAVFPYGRRGLALGVFTLGTAVAVALSVALHSFDPGWRQSSLVLGGLLVGFAGVAAVALPDDGGARRHGSPVLQCLRMLRQASTTSLSVLYAFALGGLGAIAVYLPVYLSTAVGLAWPPALAVTGAVVGLAAGARLAGGWWTDRRPTARLLVVCYAVAAVPCAVLAVEPRRWWLTVPMIVLVAACDGVASGALLALIGKAARRDSVGTIMGMAGAAAALGALLPPLLLAGAGRLTRSYATAWILLAVALLAAALYVRAQHLRVGLGLTARREPEPSPTAMTVAAVAESETELGAAAVVARLAELATSDELVVVYGSDRPARPQASAQVLLTGLRARLPRHSVMAVRVAQHSAALGRLAPVLVDLVDDGTVAIAVTPTARMRGVAAELSQHLDADRVLLVSYSLAEGAGLEEVWNRATSAASR